MTNKEILKKVIEKAVENEYILPKWIYNPKSIEHIGSAILRCNYLEKLIFSHDFAKAFWGKRGKKLIRYYEAYMDNDLKETISKKQYDEENPQSGFHFGKEYKILNKGWQHYLQQMILEKEPLKYLAKYI